MQKILLTTLIVGGLGVFFITRPIEVHAAVNVSGIVLGICGNGLIEPLEQCDGTDIAGKNCQDLGYATGTVSCSSSCSFIVEECVPFPATATSSTPVYDSNGYAREVIRFNSNPNYPYNNPSSPQSTSSTSFKQSRLLNLATTTYGTISDLQKPIQSTTTILVRNFVSNIKPTKHMVTTSFYWILVLAGAVVIVKIKKISLALGYIAHKLLKSNIT